MHKAAKLQYKSTCFAYMPPISIKAAHKVKNPKNCSKATKFKGRKEREALVTSFKERSEPRRRRNADRHKTRAGIM